MVYARGQVFARQSAVRPRALRTRRLTVIVPSRFLPVIKEPSSWPAFYLKNTVLERVKVEHNMAATTVGWLLHDQNFRVRWWALAFQKILAVALFEKNSQCLIQGQEDAEVKGNVKSAYDRSNKDHHG